MFLPRRRQLEAAPPLRAFHLWSRMAPGLALLADDKLKIWAQKLLQRLATSYAVKVQAFALKADEIHLVLQWTPQAAAGWDDAEAERRWLLAHPPQLWGAAKAKAEAAQAAGGGLIGPSAPGTMGEVPMGEAGLVSRAPRVPAAEAIRRKLGSLSMFMKQFKQMLAQHINRRMKRRGSIWHGRFHLSALANPSEVAGAMAFVDLRAVAERGGQRPEEPAFTSLHARVAWYKGKFGLPPYGPLAEPGGDMQPLPAEVTAELREPQDPWERGAPPPQEPGMPPVMPPVGPNPAPMTPPDMPPTMPPIVGMEGSVPPPMPGMDLPPGMADPGMPMPPPMTGWDPMAVPPMPGMGTTTTPLAPPADVPPASAGFARAFWLAALRDDSPIPGVDAPPGTPSPDVLGWLSLRKYLALLDGLVAQAKAWPHLPAGAPGRAKPPPTPAWGGALAALAALGLDAAGFAAPWVRMAKVRG